MKVLHSKPSPRRQHGAVLIVALLFLVILTLLGLTAMSGTTLEERMSGNSRDMNIALQAAEAALRDARRDINRLPISGEPREMYLDLFGDAAALGTCNQGERRGLCREPSPVELGPAQEAVMPPSLDLGALHAASLTSGNPTYATYGEFTRAPLLRATVEGTRNRPLARQPLYIIELFCLPTRNDTGFAFPPGENCKFYRITARGYGVNPNSQVTLQEIFLAL
jgi:type IV pilus assembly protein PilX